MEDYQHLTTKYKRFMAVKNDPYFNALQVKYSYAITCHKSQGGQEKSLCRAALLTRWSFHSLLPLVVHAMTRAKAHLYLIGFGKEYFSREE